ncbi:MAG: VWA domain-containing protein [Eubacterium sp.]|nr:VWA domain-containing protein [Eubacterium sp.]
MKKKSTIRRIFLVLLCLCLILPSFSGLIVPADITPGTVEHTADGDTTDSYRNLVALRDNSRRAGRVWADKSVFTDSIELDMTTDGIDKNTIDRYLLSNSDIDVNGENIQIMNGSDFLHVFSALGSSQRPDKLQPLDVVFVLDTSASMSSQGESQFTDTDYEKPVIGGETNKNPRLEYTTDALNAAVDLLMEKGDFNRVALVSFNIGAETIMPLGRYEKTHVKRKSNQSKGYHNNEERYFTIAQCSNPSPSLHNNGYTGDTGRYASTPTYYDNRFEQQYTNSGTIRFVDSKGTPEDWKIIEINAVPQPGQDSSIKISSSYNGKADDGTIIPAIHTSAGTDTTWGIKEGMQILATEKNTKLTLYNDINGKLTDKASEAVGPAVAKIQRQPIIVVLTDGAPNPNSTGLNGSSRVYTENWWDCSGTSVSKSVINRYHEANGLLVAASAAYQKQQVEKNYYGSIPTDKDKFKSLVYNFGICMDNPDSATANTAHDGQIAQAALNPSSFLKEPNKYDYFRTISGWWNTYISNSGRGTPRFNNASSGTAYGTGEYTMYHPPREDINTSTLDYPTMYDNIDDPSRLEYELSKLILKWVGDAFNPIEGKNDLEVDNALTYMDPIGKYMEVKDIKYVLLLGKLYEVNPSGGLKYYDKDEKPATASDYVSTRQYYKIDSKGNDELSNPSYGTDIDNKFKFKLSEIEIYVKTTNDYYDAGVGSGGIKSDLGYDQALYINIPSTALPMQVATVTTDPDDKFIKYESNIGNDEEKQNNPNLYLEKKTQSTPFRVFYEVGIDDEIKTENGNIDMTKVSPDYVMANRSGDGEDEKVYFYSNWYKKDKDPYGDYATGDTEYTYGDPVLTFSPSDKNRYYVFQKELPLYSNPNGDTVGGIVSGTESSGWSLNGTKLDTVTKIDPTKWYYILIEYYNNDGLVRFALPRLGSEFGSGIGGDDGASTENEYLCWYNPNETDESKKTKPYMENGQVTDRPGDDYIIAAATGGLRVGDMSAGIGTKQPDDTKKIAATSLDPSGNWADSSANSTSTSDTYYLPTVSSETKGDNILINIYLGNNGKLGVTNTQLLVTKTVNTIGADSDDLSKAYFDYTIKLEDNEGLLNGDFGAIKATREDNGTWRALIEKIVLKTSNHGLLLNSANGKYATVGIDTDGNIDKNGSDYYVYVKATANAYTLFDSNRGDSFHNILGSGQNLTVKAYLVPVATFDDSTWSYSDDLHLEEKDLIVGSVGFDGNTQIGFAAKLDYESESTYQTEHLNFVDGIADFKLRDGEGLLFTGLDSSTKYTVTEKLTDSQVDDGVVLMKASHKINAPDNSAVTNTYYGASTVKDNNHDFDVDKHTYSVSGETTAVLTEEVNYFNYLPKTEKLLIDHEEGDLVEVGDELTYVIYWENFAMDDEGNYVSADVTVTDRLDDGVKFVSASFAELVVSPDGEKSFNAISTPTGWSYTYNDAEASENPHTAIWHINAGAGESGYVMLTVEVKNNAEEYWNDYEELEAGTTQPDKDFEILNKAVVRVVNNDYGFDHEIDTDIVRNPIGKPHKTETNIGGSDVSEELGNLIKDEDTGFLVGPKANDKDLITYSISYINYNRENSANIIIVDKLDPGVKFVSASWVDTTLSTTTVPTDDISVKEDDVVEIEYAPGSHTVTWKIFNVDPLTDGNVTMVVKVDEEEAIKGWSYKGDGLENESSDDLDFKIFNRASVQVGALIGVDTDNDGKADKFEAQYDDPQITETVENPLLNIVNFPATGGMGNELFILTGGLMTFATLIASYFLLSDKRRKKKSM